MSNEINFNLFDILRIDKTPGADQPYPGETGEVTPTDSTSISEQSVEDARSFEIGIPILPLPQQIEDKTLLPDITKLFSEVQSKIINQLLDKWSESLADQSDRQREAQKLKTVLQDLFFSASGIVPGHETKDAATTSAVTALLLVTSAVIGSPGSVAKVVQQPGYGLFSDLSGIAVKEGLVNGAYTPAFGPVGTLFSAAAFYPSILGTLRVAGTPNRVEDRVFADSYARQIASLVSNPNFEKLIHSGILSQTSGIKNLAEGELARFIGVTKLIFLFNALAVVYKVETGVITGQEIGGLVSGEIKLPKDDSRNPLIALIHENLAPLPRENRAKLLEKFLEFYDSNPSVGDLLTANDLLRRQSEDQSSERIRQTGA